MRCETTNLPMMLTVEINKANTDRIKRVLSEDMILFQRHAVNINIRRPFKNNNAQLVVIPENAFVTDINGVCGA